MKGLEGWLAPALLDGLSLRSTRKSGGKPPFQTFHAAEYLTCRVADRFDYFVIAGSKNRQHRLAITNHALRIDDDDRSL